MTVEKAFAQSQTVLVQEGQKMTIHYGQEYLQIILSIIENDEYINKAYKSKNIILVEK